MIETDSPRPSQKIALIWSSRRESMISVQVSFDVREQDGCRIYTLGHMEEL